jgi:hypothetical protein
LEFESSFLAGAFPSSHLETQSSKALSNLIFSIVQVLSYNHTLISQITSDIHFGPFFFAGPTPFFVLMVRFVEFCKPSLQNSEVTLPV